MLVETQLNLQEIDQRFAEIQNKNTQLVLFPSNRISYANRNDNKIIIKNSIYKAVGNIDLFEQEVQLKVEISIVWKIAGLATLFLFAYAILSNKITINGNSNHTLFEKFSYLGLGLFFFLIMVFALLKQKSDFEKEIKEVFRKKAG